jgi:hypothetical protein
MELIQISDFFGLLFQDQPMSGQKIEIWYCHATSEHRESTITSMIYELISNCSLPIVEKRWKRKPSVSASSSTYMYIDLREPTFLPVDELSTSIDETTRLIRD